MHSTKAVLFFFGFEQISVQQVLGNTIFGMKFIPIYKTENYAKSESIIEKLPFIFYHLPRSENIILY